MTTIHDLARDVLHSEKLPQLRHGLCDLFYSMADFLGNDGTYDTVKKFNHGGGYFDYLGKSEGDWNEARMIFLLLLAETNPADFEPDAVSEVETLMLHGMTREEAEAAAKARLSEDFGPFYPERGSLSEWLLSSFIWDYVDWNSVYDRLYAKDARTYVSINRP